MQYCAVNGKVSQGITANDRGLAYGDGLFTTALVDHGEVINLDAHLQRLLLGCDQLGITPPLKSELITYINKGIVSVDKSVLKIMVTAGCSGRGYARSATSTPTCIVTVSAFPTHYNVLAEQGINLGISNKKMGINPMLSGLKHLNRLEQVLIKSELEQRSEDDLVVLNINDEVIEASSANLFYCIDDKWYTPLIDGSGVNGLMRQQLLKTFTDIVIQKTDVSHLQCAQALFICNSVAGIIPVHTYDNKPLSMDLVFQLRKVFNE